VKNESLEWSEVQACSPGDERLAAVLADIEKLTLAHWHEAMQKAGLDIDLYAHEKWMKNGNYRGWDRVKIQITNSKIQINAKLK